MDTKLPDEKTIKRIREIVNEYIPQFKNYKSTLGYFLEDEPYPHQVAILSVIQREIERVDSLHPVISSLQAPHQVYVFAATQNVVFSGCYPYLKKRGDLHVLGTKIMPKEIKGKIYKGYYWLCIQGFTRGDGERITRADYRLQANLEVMGGVDGLVNYTYTANRYISVPGGDENYFFTNVIEMPYKGEYDLWQEIKELGEKFIPLKGILTKLSSVSDEGISLESELIFTNLSNRNVIDLEIKELPSGEKFIFVCNIDNKNQQDARINFSKYILNQKKVYNLFELKEEKLDNNSSLEFSLSPGQMNIYMISNEIQFNQIKNDILYQKLKEGIEILKLKIQPFGLDDHKLTSFRENLNVLEGVLSTHSTSLWFDKLTIRPELVEGLRVDTERSALGGPSNVSKGNLSGEILSNYLETLSKLELSAFGIMEEDLEFSKFLKKFNELEDSLYKIEDFIKQNKMKTQKVSQKQAEKYGTEAGVQWKIISPNVNEIDKKFFPLAQRYLSIKTKFINGQWRDINKNDLENLYKDAAALKSAI